MRIGFIGVGRMGRQHAQAFARIRGCQIAAGSDPAESARGEFARLFPQADLYENPLRLLSHARVDAVVISTPNAEHLGVTLAALRARKPTLLEKPMARTVRECRRMIDTAEKCSVPLMVGHCRRFDPHWGAWRRAVLAGKIGRPVLWRHVMADIGPGGWYMDARRGGGPFFSCGVHSYDFANWMFGRPVKVLASSIKLVPAASAVDTASVVVRYASGDQLLLSWGWGIRGACLHDIIGPVGFLQVDAGEMKPQNKAEKNFDYCRIVDQSGKSRLIKSLNSSTMYVKQAQHFVHCAAGRAECLSPGTEAIRAVAVAEAVLRACSNRGMATIPAC